MEILNNDFEIGLRLLLLLSEIDLPAPEQKIAALDLITVFAKDFSLYPSNLHGDSPFNLTALDKNRNEIHLGIHFLVCNAFVDVECSDQFVYSISDRGKQVILSLEDQYASEYIKVAGIVLRRYSSCSEIDLNKMILDTAIEGENYERYQD